MGSIGVLAKKNGYRDGEGASGLVSAVEGLRCLVFLGVYFRASGFGFLRSSSPEWARSWGISAAALNPKP